MKPLSEIIRLVPIGASLNNSSFIRIRGKIIAGGTYMPAADIQQTTVIVWPLSAEMILLTVFFPVGEITYKLKIMIAWGKGKKYDEDREFLLTFGSLFTTVLIPDSSMLNIRSGPKP